jgi:CheY-like chemotaxis protein
VAEGGARVLVVDDNKVNRLVLGRTLEREGHAVSVATNGREALAMLRAEPCELLLLDMEMPELDGFAVLEILKTDPELSELPVIVTSSLEGVENVARCIELGAEDFLHKPVHPVLLKARVGSSLAKKRVRDRQRQQFRQELAHQVAERSRALGEAFAQGGAASSPTASSFGARYTLVRTLGEGGMGVVFEVERKTDGARLAAKVMTGDVSRQAAARFAREAEIGARVQHPNLVSIVDLGVTEAGAPFLVMELVTGGSLEALRPRFGEAAWAVPILRQVAQGLAALHAAGVVHRDLKPANVLLTAAGAAKVSDFGIARISLRAAIDSAGPTAAGGIGANALTGTGMWLGTPLYMAPESAEGGRTLTPAADVYAFGLLAHELLTGALPHVTPAILLALARQPIPVPPRLSLPELPPAVAAMLGACLVPEPAERPAIGAVLAALV